VASRHTTQSLQPWRWLGVPALASVCATVLLAAPFHLFGFGLPEPMFPLALAFAWAVIRPSILGPVALLALGLFNDLFWDGPMGLCVLALICAYGLALGGRALMAGQGSVVMGGWYAAACCLGLGVAFVFATMVAHEQPNLFAVIWQLLWTMALYPVLLWLVDHFEDADTRFR
jgi:rod shape-determining protein MreD